MGPLKVDILSFIIISLISYLGILVGFLIAYMAKEELKPCKKHFILVSNIILGFMLLFGLALFDMNIYIKIILPLVLVYFLFAKPAIQNKTYIFYFFAGIIFYLSSRNIDFMLIIGSLIFFYGFLVSAINLDLKQKNYLNILVKNTTFFGYFILLLF